MSKLLTKCMSVVKQAEKGGILAQGQQPTAALNHLIACVRAADWTTPEERERAQALVLRLSRVMWALQDSIAMR
jgi:hypothetical protein